MVVLFMCYTFLFDFFFLLIHSFNCCICACVSVLFLKIYCNKHETDISAVNQLEESQGFDWPKIQLRKCTKHTRMGELPDVLLVDEEIPKK